MTEAEEILKQTPSGTLTFEIRKDNQLIPFISGKPLNTIPCPNCERKTLTILLDTTAAGCQSKDCGAMYDYNALVQ